MGIFSFLKYIIICVSFGIFFTGGNVFAQEIAFDIEEAKQICDSLPLQQIEGIWIYPEDSVTVLILEEPSAEKNSQLESYSISIIDSPDCRLSPGDKFGRLFATPNSDAYKIELFTEKNNDLLLKPKSCLATLSKNGDSIIIKKEKSKFKGRLNFNFNRLLPGFWKIVSTGISPNYSNSGQNLPVGMVKIYPSYDGNGSSRRKIRYL